MNEDIKPGYTRISDILKPFNKFDMIDPAVLANAADRGTRVHEYCNAYANNIFLAEVDEDCQGYVDSFIQWYDDNVVKLLYSEERIYDDATMTTGRFDLVAQLRNNDQPFMLDNDEITLIDIKTPMAISRAWGIQLSSYSYLIEKNMNVKIDRRIVVKLSKDGKKAKEVEYEDHEKDRNLFFSALHLYHHFYNKN